jgi:ABC-type multidrug transport system fused ATPase/permease subunit
LTSDVSTLESAASDNLSILIRNLIQFLGSLIFLFLISWKLTTFIIIATPIISFAMIAIIKITKKLKK